MRSMFKWWWGMYVLVVMASAPVIADEGDYNDGDSARYRNKIVDYKEFPLSNGCVLVEVTTENRHGSVTRGVQQHESFTACPQDRDNDGDDN